jgi:hypothetical protein
MKVREGQGMATFETVGEDDIESLRLTVLHPSN